MSILFVVIMFLFVISVLVSSIQLDVDLLKMQSAEYTSRIELERLEEVEA